MLQCSKTRTSAKESCLITQLYKMTEIRENRKTVVTMHFLIAFPTMFARKLWTDTE